MLMNIKKSNRMKNFNLLTAIRGIIIVGVLLVSQSAYSQKTLRFGIRGGYDFLDQTIDKDILKSSNRVGYHLGLTLDANLPALPFGANLSVLYTHRDIETNDDDYSMQKSYYLDVPLDLTYTIGLGGIGLVLSAGPFARFNLDGGNINIKDVAETYKAKTFQAGANFGLGLNLGDHFYVGATYFTNLTDNYKETDAHFDEVFRKKPDRMALTAAYYF